MDLLLELLELLLELLLVLLLLLLLTVCTLSCTYRGRKNFRLKIFRSKINGVSEFLQGTVFIKSHPLYKLFRNRFWTVSGRFRNVFGPFSIVFDRFRGISHVFKCFLVFSDLICGAKIFERMDRVVAIDFIQESSKSELTLSSQFLSRWKF